jgi:hypothetical protein
LKIGQINIGWAKLRHVPHTILKPSETAWLLR